jgi:hypothetical protein
MKFKIKIATENTEPTERLMGFSVFSVAKRFLA